jgi:hypothetical protein
MPDAAKKPCRICRRWFRPDVRVGDGQHVCSRPECQTTRRKQTQASWRAKNPGYFVAWRIQARESSQRKPEPVRLPSPLSMLPWDLAQEEFGAKGADFIGAMGKLLLEAAKDQFEAQLVDFAKDPGPLAPALAKDQFKSQIVDSS